MDTSLVQDIFNRIVGTSLVGGSLGTRRQIEVKHFRTTGVAVRARGKVEFDQLSHLSDQQVEFDAVEEAFFA